MIQRFLRSIGLAAAALFASAAMLHANPYTFQGLGDLPGGAFYSSAYGISADGSTVVGSGSSTAGSQAFRWTPSGGMVSLGDLPGGGFQSSAYGVSADGSVVVGDSFSGIFGFDGYQSQAFRWTESGGMVGLGNFPGGMLFNYATDVSADGSVVVGDSFSDIFNFYEYESQAFRWTASGGMVGLGDFPGGMLFSYATGVSADGSVVVGSGSSDSGGQAFRWTESGGMVGLGDLPGGYFVSNANGVSADGSVIVGKGESASGGEAFRWTESGGMVGLGDLPGGYFSSNALDVSADGSVVVGVSYSTFGDEAFLWTELDGMQNLRDLLVAAGVSGLDGWILRSATAISADGRTIVGYGLNPFGQTEAWIATIAPVPEPSTWLLATFGALALLVTRRRRGRRTVAG